MRHPYRSKPETRTPALGGRARRLAAHGVSLVLFCLVARWVAFFLSPVAGVMAEVLLIVGTWLFTLRCEVDSRATRALAWVLRSAAVVDSALAIAAALHLTSWSGIGALRELSSLLLAPIVGLAFVAARLHAFGLPQLAKRVGVLALCAVVAFVCADGMAAPLVAFRVIMMFAPVILGAWIWGYIVMLRLRKALWVREREWWLDVAVLPRVEWTSVLLLADGRVEIAAPKSAPWWFHDYVAAFAWLNENRLCPEAQVKSQELVAGGPPGSVATRG